MPTQEEMERIYPRIIPEEQKRVEELLLGKITELANRVTTEEQREIARLEKWISELQSGMYINCVYCGHRYGPDPGTPVVMADVLKEHIEKCPKHPLSEARREIAALEKTATEQDNCILHFQARVAALKAEIEKLKFGREPLP